MCVKTDSVVPQNGMDGSIEADHFSPDGRSQEDFATRNARTERPSARRNSEALRLQMLPSEMPSSESGPSITTEQKQDPFLLTWMTIPAKFAEFPKYSKRSRKIESVN